MIKVEISYTKEEMERFFRFQLMIKEKLRYLYIGVSFLFGLGAAYVMLWKNQFILGVVLIILALVCIFAFPLQTKKIIKKQIASRYNRPNQELVITRDTLEHFTDKGLVEYSWDDIIEVNEISTCFYLYISKHKALIINKQNFREGDKDDFIKILKEKGKKIIFYKHF